MKSVPVSVLLRGGISLVGVACLLMSMLPLSLQASSRVSQQVQGTAGDCQVFPANNVWNADISQLPVAGNSNNYMASIGLNKHLHPDFGSGLYDGAPFGFPVMIVPPNQAGVPTHFDYADESDPGPYPVPLNAPIEGGTQSSGDRHVLVVQSGTCKLYELFAAYAQSDGSWKAGSGATWNLASNDLRPRGWTSADAAGLPILPGLVSYDEVMSGAIHHALRFTVDETQNSFLWPARHQASSQSNPNLPPMGLRLRLKADFDISGFSPTNQVILRALQHYGMFVADNGSSLFLSGTQDDRWNNDDLHALTTIPGSAFEAVDESSLEVNENSGEVQLPAIPTPTPTATFTPTPTPGSAVLPDIKNKASQNTSSNLPSNYSSDIIVSVIGGIVIILVATGILFGVKRKKRQRPQER